MTSPTIVKEDLVADLTYRKQLATIENTAAVAAVAALTGASPAPTRYKVQRRAAIAADRLDKLTKDLIFANQLP